MIASLLVIAALLLTGARDNNASPTATARMTVSKMRMADLESSAGGYAYNQRPGLPVSYVRYTNHGSGRYYHAPTPVHYVVGSPAPVAPAVSETALPHETVLLPYTTTTKHEIAPYAARQPYPRDGFINYGVGQLAKYAQPLEPPKLAPRAPYYTPSAFQPTETRSSVNKRVDDNATERENKDDDSHDDDNDDDNDDDDDDDDNDDDVGDDDDGDDAENEDENKDQAIENRERQSDSNHQVHNSHSNTDVSFEHGDGVKHSAARNSAHGEKANEEYQKREKFDVGEHGRHDEGGQLEHYNTETENKKEHSDVAGNYGRDDEATWGEKGSSYGQTSYRKKGQKTSGFHKVYHKDEYKKDTDFYDESHKKGYFDKHAAADGHYNVSTGDFKESGHRESQSDYENNGRKAHYDKGHAESREQGYNKEKGEDSFHTNRESYNSDKDTRLRTMSTTDLTSIVN